MRLTPNDTLGLTPVAPSGWLGRRLPGLEFKPDAIVEGVAFRLMCSHKNILARFGAIGIWIAVPA